MIVIVDYGMGNLRSAQKGFEHVGFEALVTSDPAALDRASGIVLPGVGAFKDCYEGLNDGGFSGPLMRAVDRGTPLLGICVGMQLLFDYGEEGDGSPGLGLLSGRVVRFPDHVAGGCKVPHMGWNVLKKSPTRPCPILEDTGPGPYMYFVHSYYARPTSDEIVYATSEHGVEFPAVVGRGRVYGVQFHPEKSQKEGMSVLNAFGNFVRHAVDSGTIRCPERV